MKPKYEIGQEIFWASFSSHTGTYVTCPDCGGTGRLRVTFHDETTVSIECKNCSRGYDPPTGRIHIYTRKGEAKKGRVSGIKISDDKVEYEAEYWYTASDGHFYKTHNHVKEDEVCLSESEAQSRADKMAAEHDAEERARIFGKEKDARSWAWNASYHRKEIKEAERRLAYHTAKLNVAKVKAKEGAA